MMRIYFIHVYRRHWEFYPEDERDDTFEEDDPEAAPRTWLYWIKTAALRAWRSVEGAETGVRLHVRRIIDRLNKRVDPTEPMLRRIRHAPALEITYPSGISEAYVRRRLRLLLLHKTQRHRRRIYVNAALLPLTAAAGLLPGPNVFLAWNGYRLFAHIRAWHGGQRVLNGQIDVVFTPSDELNDLLSPEERLIKPLDRSLAHTISQRFEIPGLVDYLHRTGSLTADEQV